MGHLELNTEMLKIRVEADDNKYTYEQVLKKSIKLLKRELKELDVF